MFEVKTHVIVRKRDVRLATTTSTFQIPVGLITPLILSEGS